MIWDYIAYNKKSEILKCDFNKSKAPATYLP